MSIITTYSSTVKPVFWFAFAGKFDELNTAAVKLVPKLILDSHNLTR